MVLGYNIQRASHVSYLDCVDEPLEPYERLVQWKPEEPKTTVQSQFVLMYSEKVKLDTTHQKKIQDEHPDETNQIMYWQSLD